MSDGKLPPSDSYERLAQVTPQRAVAESVKKPKPSRALDAKVSGDNIGDGFGLSLLGFARYKLDALLMGEFVGQLVDQSLGASFWVERDGATGTQALRFSGQLSDADGDTAGGSKVQEGAEIPYKYPHKINTPSHFDLEDNKMNLDMNTVRLLGAAQLTVFVAAMLGRLMLTSVVRSGSISDILVNISKNVTLMRVSNLVALVESLAIVVLGVLFYIVFNRQYEIIALVALGFFLAEATTLAVSKIGAFALIPLSQEFVEAGAPEPSYFQTLGDFLYYGVDRQRDRIHNLFFCLGGILWYYLLLISGASHRHYLSGAL